MVRRDVLRITSSVSLVVAIAGCSGSEFSVESDFDGGGGSGANASGGSGADGGAGAAGSGGGGHGGGGSGGGGSGGTVASGGTGGAGAGGSGGIGEADAGERDSGVMDAGTCSPLTTLTFQNGGFESGGLLPGWGGAPNPPYYAEVVPGAARSGAFGVEFNDIGTGLPGIQQPVPVPTLLAGRQVAVEAWVRLVTFPSVRLLVWANNALGTHLASAFADTQADVDGWQRISTTITIAPATDHLMVMLVSALPDGDGIAHCDDVRICFEGACSSC